jgi:tetratricopeptide (TPR) repeat protein
LLCYTEKEWLSPNLEAIMLLLKLGNWDPINCNYFFNVIRQKTAEASSSVKERLAYTLKNVWANFFPIHPQEGAFAMNLGVLFYEMGNIGEALNFFYKAIEMGYEKADVCNNIATCFFKLGDLEKGKTWQQRGSMLQKEKTEISKESIQ